MSFPWLTVIGAVPLVGAAVVARPARAGWPTGPSEVALGVSLRRRWSSS